MPIENRELEPGTRLVARYKGEDRTLTVEQTEEGVRYVLDDGYTFKSLSSAGKAVMGGVACNGWRFWSIEGTQLQRPPRKEKAPKATKPAKKNAPAKKGAKKAKGKAVRAASRGSYGCGACGETFGTQKAALEHALSHSTS